MSLYYLDASAFVKLIEREPQSEALSSLLARSTDRPVSSGLLRAEAMRAVRSRNPEQLVRTRALLRRVDLVPIDDPILDEAGLLDPAVMRTLDAIHLATALNVGPDLTAVVTYDQRMREGARLLGLSVQSPA